MGNQIGSGTNSYLPNIKNIRNLQLFKDYVSNTLKQIEEAFDYWIKSPYVKKKTLSKEEFEELFSQLFVDPIKHYELLKVSKINAVVTIDVFIIFSLFCSQCTLKDKIKFIIQELILRREYFIKQTQNTYLQQITSSSSVMDTNGSSTTVPTTIIVPPIIVPTSLRLDSIQQMSYRIFCSMPILFKNHDIDDHHLIKTDLYTFIEISLKHFIERTLLSGIMQQEAKKLEDSENNYNDITTSIVTTTTIKPPKEPKSSLVPLKESIKDHLPSDRLYSFNEIWHWTQDNFHLASYLEHIHNISVQIYTKIFSDFSKIKQKSFVLRTSFFASSDESDSNPNSPSRNNNNNMSPLTKLLYQFQPNITDPFDSLLSRRTFIWKYSIQEFLQDEYYQSSIVPGSSHQSVRGIPYVMNDCPIIYALEHMVLSQIFSVAVFQFTSSNSTTSFTNMTININNLSSLPSTTANTTANATSNPANNTNNPTDNSDSNNAGVSSTYRAMVMEKEKLSAIQNASVELIGIINYQTIVRYLLEHSPKYLLKDILLEERKKREKRLSYEFSLNQIHLNPTKPTNTPTTNNMDSEFDDNFSDYNDEDDDNQSVTSFVNNNINNSNTNIINSMNNLNETSGVVNPTLSFITETRSLMDASVKRRLRNMRWAKKLGEGLLTTNVTTLLYRKEITSVNKDIFSGSDVPVVSKQGTLRFGSISANLNNKDKANQRINNNKQVPQVLPQYQDLPMEFVTMDQSVYNLLHLFSLGHQTVPILNHNANNTGTTNTTIPNLFPTNKSNEYQGLSRTTTIGAIDRFVLALVQNHHISDFLYTYYDELFSPKVQDQSIMYTIHSLRPANDMHELAEYALSVENKFNLGSMLFRMTRDRKQPVNNLPGAPPLFSPLDSKPNHDDERVDACLLLTKPLQSTKENNKESTKEKEIKSEPPSTTNTPTAAASASATPTSTQSSSDPPIPNPNALKCCGVLTLHHSLELLYWMFRLHNLPNATNATSVASHLQQPQQISNPRSPRAQNNTNNNNSNNNSTGTLPIPDINLKNLQELIDLFRQGKFHVPISTIPIVNTNHCIVNNTSLTSNQTLGTSIAQQILNIYNIDTTNWTAFTMLNEKISNIEADFVNEFHAAKQMQSLGELANPKILYNYDEFVDLIQPIQPNTEAQTNTKNTTAGGLRKTRTYIPSSSQLSGSQAAYPPATPMNNMAPSPRGMPSPRGGLPSPRGGYEPSSPRQSANSNPNNSTVSTPMGGRPIRGRKSGATTVTAQQRILREKKYAEAKNRVDRTRRLEEWFRKVKVLSPKDTLREALYLMTLTKTSTVYVVNTFGELLGHITLQEICNYLLFQDQQDHEFYNPDDEFSSFSGPDSPVSMLTSNKLKNISFMGGSVNSTPKSGLGLRKSIQIS